MNLSTHFNGIDRNRFCLNLVTAESSFLEITMTLLSLKSRVTFFSEDTPLGETRVGDLPKWLSRRNYSPTAMGRCLSRAYWRWQHKYMQPRYAGLTPAIQVKRQSYWLLFVI